MSHPNLDLDLAFEARHGEAVTVAPSILRITAPNAGPYTFHGTNSYLLGEGPVVLVDPGPDNDRHLAALLQAIDGRAVEAILLTHTHRDHTGLARRLQTAVAAPILAEGPHRPSRPLGADETLDGAGDAALIPDRTLKDGEDLGLSALSLRAIATPGHTANHMAFSVEDEGILLTGDHVMAWSTTIVAPPDGSMADYMSSLDRLLARRDRFYLPGHGGPVQRPGPFVRALRSHRQMREAAILERLRAGDRTIGEIVAAIYRQTDPQLHGAAALSVLAHLEHLALHRRVTVSGAPRLGSRYAIA